MTSFSLRTQPYPHQLPAIDKLRRPRVGGLFMDMGTGKTYCSIDLAQRRQNRTSNIFWFTPVSLKETARQEILKHTDCRPSDIYTFDDSTSIRRAPKSATWYIVGIESMSSSDRQVLTANHLVNKNSFVIVDESSYIKGHRSRRTERITHLAERARYRLILTGTPISQGVVDLYAQMRFLSPKILGYNSFYSFAANHLEYSDKYPGLIVRAHNTGYLAAKIAPYVYQITKEDAGLNLPPKLFDTWYYSMSYAQMAAYWQAKEEILLSRPDDEIDSIVIFELFTALQQIVCGFWNRRCPVTGRTERLEFPNGRLSILQNILLQLPENEKIIIWCKYRFSIRRIVEALTTEYGPDSAAQFHGGLSESKRNQSLAHFRREARFFVATAAAGGHGLNLTESAYTIFYEDEFKYANRLQAEDRNHRIGQERRPTYISVVCSGTIDERIQKSHAKKGDAVEDFRRRVDGVKGHTARGKALREMVKDL